MDQCYLDFRRTFLDATWILRLERIDCDWSNPAHDFTGYSLRQRRISRPVADYCEWNLFRGNRWRLGFADMQWRRTNRGYDLRSSLRNECHSIFFDIIGRCGWSAIQIRRLWCSSVISERQHVCGNFFVRPDLSGGGVRHHPLNRKYQHRREYVYGNQSPRSLRNDSYVVTKTES